MATGDASWVQILGDDEEFIESEIQLVDDHEPGYWEPSSKEFVTTYPTLTKLLRLCSVTVLSIDGVSHHVYTWDGPEEGAVGWVCPVPIRTASHPNGWDQLCSAHQLLLQSFGGVRALINGFDYYNWLQNHWPSIRLEDSGGTATFLADNEELVAALQAESILLDTYYPFAHEHNGNMTLCNRNNGRVIQFAHDTARKDIQSIPGLPKRTFYSINSAPDFESWIEQLAIQLADFVIG